MAKGIPQYAAKRDANEAEIVQQLRGIPGLSVYRLSARGIPDLLIGYRGVTYLAEVKQPGKKWTADQVAFIEAWAGSPVIRAECIEDILSVINEG